MLDPIYATYSRTSVYWLRPWIPFPLLYHTLRRSLVLIHRKEFLCLFEMHCARAINGCSSMHQYCPRNDSTICGTIPVTILKACDPPVLSPKRWYDLWFRSAPRSMDGTAIYIYFAIDWLRWWWCKFNAHYQCRRRRTCKIKYLLQHVNRS